MASVAPQDHMESWIEVARHSMEVTGYCPLAALGLIAKGDGLIINVDHREMLVRILEAIGASEHPQFNVSVHEQLGVRVTINMDVSGALNCVGQKLNVAVVEGDPCNNLGAAVKSAVLKAVAHLNNTHLIKVKDYSSRVIRSIQECKTFVFLHPAFYNVERLLDQWESTISKCEELKLCVVEKATVESGSSECRCVTDIYRSMADFLDGLLDMYKEKGVEARCSTTELESDRQRYMSMTNERFHAVLQKGYLQDVFIQTRHILDYVLGYIGASKATYTNTPASDGLTKSVVSFNIPRYWGIEFSGNIAVEGNAKGCEQAEEAASYKALLFMEKKYKITIVDLNREERNAVKKEHNLVLNILDQLLDNGDDIRLIWRNMNKTIAAERSAYAVQPESLFTGPIKERCIEAYKFCANLVEVLEKDSATRFNECTSSFDALDEMQATANEIRATGGLR